MFRFCTEPSIYRSLNTDQVFLEDGCKINLLLVILQKTCYTEKPLIVPYIKIGIEPYGQKFSAS